MMTGADIEALKQYVQAPDGGMQNRGAGTVLLQVTHSNLSQRFMEIRLDMHMTVDSIKGKLVSHTGTNISTMELQLKNPRGKLLANLEPSRMLGFYSPQDGDVLHVIDSDPMSASANGWLEDLSKVQKYVMSEEDYNQRENTYRRFKEEKLRHLAQEDPEWTLEKEIANRRGQTYQSAASKQKVEDVDFQQEEASSISMGDRCEVHPGGKRGAIRYVGRCEELPLGFWVGVEYDEPVGKNDGSVKGHRYFQANPGYGGMVRPANVTVGDFPPLEINFSDEDEI